MSATERPRIAVLLCTFNGQAHLAAQLDSIAAQTVPDWRLWASDDGSADGTRAILERYAADWGGERLTLVSGPQAGPAANFLALTCRPEIAADFYAWADQDDIWLPDKLARAVQWLGGVPREVPALYCARTRLVDEAGRDIGCSPLFARRPGFANALVQSIAGGNTMVFNEAARQLVREAGEGIEIVVHDWWLYLLVAGCGGRVHYDPEPGLCYRQHGANAIGSGAGWGARLGRLALTFGGRQKRWNEVHLRALQTMRRRLTADNARVLDAFCDARRRSLPWRLLGLKRAGVYRQTLLGNLGLVAAAVLDRL